MDLIKKNCGVVILAAGLSYRMGSPKAFLQWDKNTVFLEKIIRVYIAFGCSEIIVVLNQESMNYYKQKGFTFLENVHVQINKQPELPRFVSVRLGFEKVTNDFCFIQNIDNPFVNLQLLKLLFKQKCALEYVVPTNNNKSGHPILLSKEICNYITSLNGNEHILKDVLKRFDRVSVDTSDAKIHCNINVREDLGFWGLCY